MPESPTVAIARETARTAAGQFGEQANSVPEVKITPDAPYDGFREDLLESVRDWRDQRTTPAEAQVIRDWWDSHGIQNQFAAAARAHELGKSALPR